MRITIVPHTHWDREWYEPFRVFSGRLVGMMDALVELAESGLRHFHLDGQTAVIDDYLAQRPEREDAVRRLVAAGRLSAGPWVTQMDEFLVSGESHVRNLERGLARATELGRALAVGYLPDQFGHIGQMPQILRAAGIDRAVVWRGVPEAIDRDVFWWESPDGSRVLTQYLAFGYSNGDLVRRAAGPDELAATLERVVGQQQGFAASDGLLVMLGDDHSGPSATLQAWVDEARSKLDEVDVAIGRLDDHIDRQRLVGEPPVWRGELRSGARAHLLPNVYSARVHQKRERGRVESLLERYAEPLAALVPGFTWPEERLARAWTLLLWNGAHDSACGCSHDEVADDVDARFAEAASIADAIVTEALSSLTARTEAAGVLRFNPSPFTREGIPGLGYGVTDAVTPSSTPVPIKTTAAGLVVDGLPLRVLDEPDVGDLYTFCFAEPGQVPAPPVAVEVEGGRAVLTWDGLRVELSARRREDEPFVRIEGAIDNERPDHRLRLHVGLGSPVDGTRAGAPFELVSRPLVGEGGLGETASPTWPAHGVVAAGDVGVLMDGVFEYEVVERRELAVTLLRCVGTISRNHLATRPFAAGPDVATPAAQMIGRTAFSLALMSRADPADLWRHWERFALPIAEVEPAGGGISPASASLLDVSGDAVLSAIRQVEGAVEVRLWNARTDHSVDAMVGGRPITLGPAEIRTVRLDPDVLGT